MSQLAKAQAPGVTKAVVTAAAKRKRRQRAREHELLYSREDWQLFLDRATLPQKAGCQPGQLRKVVLKELVDNQLDASAQAELVWEEESKEWVIRGTNNGLSVSAIPKLFSVNRPLVSSKLKRRVTRGLLGNGLRVVMGAVHALGGSIAVSVRGRSLILEVNPADGKTKIVQQEPVSLDEHAMRVRINLGQDSEYADGRYAQDAIDVADQGTLSTRASSPWWYGARDLHMLFCAASANATAGDVLADLGWDYKDERLAKSLTYQDAKILLEWLRATHKPVPPEKLGRLGQDAFGYDGYGIKLGELTTPTGARVPYVIEVWALAKASEKKGVSEAEMILFVNRTRALAPFYASAASGGIRLRGCGISHWIKLKSAQYEILVSILSPYVQLAGDGKEPVLPPFGNTLEEALKRACNAAHRLMDKPAGEMEIKEAAYLVMEEAYQIASGEGTLPAKARQIMYAARPKILELTGRLKFGDDYFTQTLLPNFQEDYPELTADWNVVYDARGHFIEPHTNYEIGLGTIEVKDYLASKPEKGPAVSLSGSQLYPTRGPLNRYGTIVFIEKEGFGPLLKAAQIAKCFDVGFTSSKGMTVTALRKLLDELSETGHLKNVLVLHDFDVYGFSIFGTLFNNTRRYKFQNKVRVIDIGLRLEDVQEMGLDPEPYNPENWDARVKTLRRHGATQEEIEFLRTHRVELNAMTAPQFVEFLEWKLALYTQKVVPEPAVVEEHARRIWEQLQAAQRCKEILAAIHAEASGVTFPPDLMAQIKQRLSEEPALSWDQALARVLETSMLTHEGLA
jgi:hypothetical protein